MPGRLQRISPSSKLLCAACCALSFWLYPTRVLCAADIYQETMEMTKQRHTGGHAKQMLLGVH